MQTPSRTSAANIQLRIFSATVAILLDKALDEHQDIFSCQLICQSQELSS